MIFLGDIHANFEDFITLLAKHDFKNENILSLGDFGLGFKKYEYQLLSSINKSLIENNNTLYVIRGNHDDPSYWSEQKLPKLKNIILIKDYSVLNIEDRNILFIGGAISVDRINRIEGRNYWKNEGIYLNDKFIKTLPENSIDLIVTHSPIVSIFRHICGTAIIDQYLKVDKKLKFDVDIEQNILEEYNKILVETQKDTLKMWISGHLHISHNEYIGKVTYKVLNINEFYELPRYNE